MGACVSSSANKNSPSSAIKLVSFGSKRDKLVIPPSPMKEDVSPVKPGWPLAGSGNGNFGCKEETFFDSQTWLESDCEDDFFSVNGDLTPSCGNSPLRERFSLGAALVYKPPVEDRPPGSVAEPLSPTEPKKKLVELFRLREDQADANDQVGLESQPEAGANMTEEATKNDVLGLPSRSAPTTPYVSGPNSMCSSERTANGDSIIEKEKGMRSVQGCIPRLVSCSSFTGRRKKMMSHAIAVNDK